MITDHISNAYKYYSCHPYFKSAFDFIQNNDFDRLKPGTYEIHDKDVFASIQDIVTKPLGEGVFEAHEKYIDIQYIAGYGECIGYANIKKLQPEAFYDQNRDIRFYSGSGAMLILEQYDFAVFFPQDGHMPCISRTNERGVSKKVVVKVRI